MGDRFYGSPAVIAWVAIAPPADIHFSGCSIMGKPTAFKFGRQPFAQF